MVSAMIIYVYIYIYILFLDTQKRPEKNCFILYFNLCSF